MEHYVYDLLGRQASIPAVDAPRPGSGDLKLGYYDTDAAYSIAQGTLGAGGTKTTFTLDGVDRRLTQTSQTDAGTNTLVRHYTDSSDNPTWSAPYRWWNYHDHPVRRTDRRQSRPHFDRAQWTVDRRSTRDLSSPRGDTATTISLPAGATGPDATAAAGIDTWTTYTEYGQPQQPVDATPGGTTGIGYGWLGGKQRASLDTGLTLMGARVYNFSSGLFTSVDPVYGGNSSAFAYPNDPVNSNDISGRRVGPHQAKFCAKGINWAVCAQGIRWRQTAINDSETYFASGRSRKYRGNAFQHAYWMALIVYSMMHRGASKARAVGRARALGIVHERDDLIPMDAEGQRDIVNNRIGSRIGAIAYRNGWSRAKLRQRIRYLASRKCVGRNCLQAFYSLRYR